MHVEISIFFFFFAKVQISLKLIIKNRLHKLNYSDRSLFLLVRMYCGKKRMENLEIIVVKCTIFLFCQRRSNVQQIYNEWSCPPSAFLIKWFLTVWRKTLALEGIKWLVLNMYMFSYEITEINPKMSKQEQFLFLYALWFYTCINVRSTFCLLLRCK